ncbi:MAG: DUF72 domain-containing protein [bacterium JZ-2024 1]
MQASGLATFVSPDERTSRSLPQEEPGYNDSDGYKRRFIGDARLIAPEYDCGDEGVVVGTAGWGYAGWVGNFYPKGTNPGQQLQEYAKRLPAVEVDATFHHWIAHDTIRSWVHRTPPGFLFCPKMHRSITHEKGLENCEGERDAFVSSVRRLGEKLGPVVIQFSPSFEPKKMDMLARFLESLPRDLRYAVEVRSRRWVEPDPEPFLKLLREHRVAYVVSDVPTMSPQAFVTTDFAYARVLGDYRKTERIYREKGIDPFEQKFSEVLLDRSEEIAAWVEYVRRLRTQTERVFLFFNNHFAGHAPSTLAQFAEIYRREIC